jgi:E3 ubiquitin-protein ligase RNF115/126
MSHLVTFTHRFSRGPGDRTSGGGLGIPPQQAMINHLLFALAQRHTDRQPGIHPLAELLGMYVPANHGQESGRWGDYVYNQEGKPLIGKWSNWQLNNVTLALDQIITQLMENSNANRPVPATDEIIEKLPQEVLLEGCKFPSCSAFRATVK